jgi:hypothetical protein
MDTIHKSTKTLIDTSKEVGPEVNAQNIEYILMSHHWDAGQNYNIKIVQIL